MQISDSFGVPEIMPTRRSAHGFHEVVAEYGFSHSEGCSFTRGQWSTMPSFLHRYGAFNRLTIEETEIIAARKIKQSTKTEILEL